MDAPQDLVTLQWVVIVVLAGVFVTVVTVLWKKNQSLEEQLRSTIESVGKKAEEALTKERKDHQEALEKQQEISNKLVNVINEVKDDRDKLVGVLEDQKDILDNISKRLPRKGGRDV